MYQCPRYVKRDTKQPQNEQDRKYRPEHREIPFSRPVVTVDSVLRLMVSVTLDHMRLAIMASWLFGFHALLIFLALRWDTAKWVALWVVGTSLLLLLSILSLPMPTVLLGHESQKCEAIMTTKKGALFIRCGEEEAERIRYAAKSERRTLSGYILNAVLNRIDAREKMLREADNRVGNQKIP